MEGMRTHARFIRFKPSPDRRFFAAWFAWARSCCGPAPAIPQILVGQNARPPASVLGYSPRRDDRRTAIAIGGSLVEIAGIAETPNRFRQARSVDGPHLHVAAGRVLERRQAAFARYPRGYLGAGLCRQPVVPVVPPRAGKFPGARLPVVEGRRIRGRLVQPVLVLLVARRIDDAGDVARAGQHETHR